MHKDVSSKYVFLPCVLLYFLNRRRAFTIEVKALLSSAAQD